jgi:hypothetical protein
MYQKGKARSSLEPMDVCTVFTILELYNYMNMVVSESYSNQVPDTERVFQVRVIITLELIVSSQPRFRQCFRTKID